jgi:serine/threonine-protein kinase
MAEPTPPAGTRSDASLPPAGTLGDADLPPSPSTAPHVPQTLPSELPLRLGRYEIAGELGRGGMGLVLRVRDPDLDRELAVKLLQPQNQHQEQLERRFLEEARITGRLEHPGIPAVHELGRADDGRPFFAMKLIRGRTLVELLHERPNPSHDLPRFLGVFEQLCQTIAYAHAHGVLHRDLKPANVMVGKFGEVQVMDWGLAKIRSETESAEPPRPAPGSVFRPSHEGLSQAGTVLGTPGYMAPEQARGEVARLDERADVFGLGAILCEILTGRQPYAPGPEWAMLMAAAEGQVTDALDRLDHCGADAELIALAKECLAVEVSARPRDGGELAARVTAYRTSVQERLHAAELERAAAQARAIEERKRRRLTVALAAIVLTLAALGLVGWRWWEGQQQEARRRRETDRTETEAAVAQLLVQAEERQRQARADPTGESPYWTEALAAAKQAQGRLERAEASDEMRARVQALVAELAAQQRDQTLRAELETIRLEEAEMRGQKSDRTLAAAHYAKTFRAYDVDLTQLPPAEAAERLSRSALRVELAAALDDWAGISADDAALPPRLREIARRADPDPWRTQVRDAVAAKDRKAMEELARSPEAADLPAPSAVLLARTLDEAEASPEAVRLLSKAQQRYPGDYWINVELGRLHYNSKPPALDSAVRFYSIAAALRSRNAHVHMLLANVLADKGRAAEAEVEYREAIRLKADYAAPHYGLGLHLRRAGKPDEAVREYREALHLNPDLVHAHVALGNVLWQTQKSDAAIASFEEALRLDRLDPYALKGVGQARLIKGRIDEAIVCFRGALCIDDELQDARANLGVSLLQQGKVDEALATLREAARRETSAPLANFTHRNVVAALIRKYGLPASVQTSFQWASLRPKGLAEGYGGVAKALIDRNQLEEAIVCFREALRHDPDSFLAHYGIGVSEIKRGRMIEAVPSLREAMRVAPGTYGGYYSMGVVLSKQGKWTEAVPLFRTTVALKPDLPVAYKDLGDGLAALGQWEDAVDAYRGAVRVKPDYAEAALGLGSCLGRMGQPGDALVALRRVLDRLPAGDRFRAGLEKQIEEHQRAAALEAKLPEFLKGTITPADAAERLVLAELCQGPSRRLYAAATRYYEEALAATPKSVGRCHAACAAAQAGCGRGDDANKPDDKERTRLRRLALTWLRDDLEGSSKLADDDKPRSLAQVQQAMQRFRGDPGLAGVRDKAALDKLPNDERQDWQKLWADIDALLKKTEGK